MAFSKITFSSTLSLLVATLDLILKSIRAVLRKHSFELVTMQGSLSMRVLNCMSSWCIYAVFFFIFAIRSVAFHPILFDQIISSRKAWEFAPEESMYTSILQQGARISSSYLQERLPVMRKNWKGRQIPAMQKKKVLKSKTNRREALSPPPPSPHSVRMETAKSPN